MGQYINCECLTRETGIEVDENTKTDENSKEILDEVVLQKR